MKRTTAAIRGGALGVLLTVLGLAVSVWMAVSFRHWREEARWKATITPLLQDAERGDSGAMFALGQAFEQKRRSFDNFKVAERWYEKSQRAGNIEASDKLRFIRHELVWLSIGHWFEPFFRFLGWSMIVICALLIVAKVLHVISLSRSVRRAAIGQGTVLDGAKIAKHVIHSFNR